MVKYFGYPIPKVRTVIQFRKWLWPISKIGIAKNILEVSFGRLKRNKTYG